MTFAARFLPMAFVSALCGIALTGCSRQVSAYAANPICAQAKQKCKQYYEMIELAKTDRGAATDLLREDCEASQRACSDGVNRSLETSRPEKLGTRSGASPW